MLNFFCKTRMMFVATCEGGTVYDGSGFSIITSAGAGRDIV
jgi:hypothetical protein